MEAVTTALTTGVTSIATEAIAGAVIVVGIGLRVFRKVTGR